MEHVQTASGIYVPQTPAILRQNMDLGGVFHWQHIRDGKVIDEGEDHNLVTDEGINYLLAAGLAAGSAIGTWYLGLFEGNYTPVTTDTAANIAANSTESSAFAAGVRQVWTPGAVAGKAVSNAASRGDFVFNATKTIYGAFLASNPTIGSTTGKLFAAARFGTAKVVANLDELLLTYAFSGSSS